MRGGGGGLCWPYTSDWRMVSQSGEKMKRFPIKSLLGVLDSSMCSDGDNGDGEEYVPYDSDSGESVSDELI